MRILGDERFTATVLKNNLKWEWEFIHRTEWIYLFKNRKTNQELEVECTDHIIKRMADRIPEHIGLTEEDVNELMK